MRLFRFLAIALVAVVMAVAFTPPVLQMFSEVGTFVASAPPMVSIESVLIISVVLTVLMIVGIAFLLADDAGHRGFASGSKSLHLVPSSGTDVGGRLGHSAIGHLLAWSAMLASWMQMRVRARADAVSISKWNLAALPQPS